MTEVWKPIPGYGDKYEVSNLGRVKTKPFLAQAAKKARHNARFIRKYFTRLDDMTADLV